MAQPVYHCVVCGRDFVVYGDVTHPGERRTCDSARCILHLARRDPLPAPLLCTCPQRPWPHELTVHQALRRESYDPRLRGRWPWSLAHSDRLELSAERA